MAEEPKYHRDPNDRWDREPVGNPAPLGRAVLTLASEAVAAERARWEKVVQGLVEALERMVSQFASEADQTYQGDIETLDQASAALATAREHLGE